MKELPSSSSVLSAPVLCACVGASRKPPYLVGARDYAERFESLLVALDEGLQQGGMVGAEVHECVRDSGVDEDLLSPLSVLQCYRS